MKHDFQSAPVRRTGSRAGLFARSAVGLVLITGLLSPAFMAFGAAPVAAPSSTAGSTNNNLLIVSTNGGDFSASSAVFRGAVQVVEPQMYLECELLSVFFQTNAANRVTAAGGMTNVNARLDMIIAETNLLMMARDIAIIGDRAVYTASNETVVVTGELVVIETEMSYTYGEHFVFNRRTGRGRVIGWEVTELKIEGTNSLKTPFGPTLRKPASASGAKTNPDK